MNRFYGLNKTGIKEEPKDGRHLAEMHNRLSEKYRKEDKIFAFINAVDVLGIIATGNSEEEVIKKVLEKWDDITKEEIYEQIDDGEGWIIKIPKTITIDIEEECNKETEGRDFILENKDVEIIRGD